MTGIAGAPLLFSLALAFVAATAGTYAAILVLRPTLQRLALAQPNARSSHTRPTPQGGGLAVVGLTVLLVGLAMTWEGLRADTASQLALVGAAVLLLAAISAIDDIRGLAALPRLAIHIMAVAAMLAALPSDLRVIPALPISTERVLLAIAAIWFINLVNFMDGIDWMTVAEVVPICVGLTLAGAFHALPPLGVLTATILGGAMIGFAPFNRPVATLFLGDVGSVPIGLILVWLLLQLAGSGHVAAALLLPLYYLADASITLARRLVRGDTVWQAHRTHFYQVATDRGFTVGAIVAQVAIVNVALVVLALATIAYHAVAVDWIALGLGGLLVAALLRRFVQGQPSAGRVPP